MENALYNISQILGITIIHSLWQGLVIYILVKTIMLFSAYISPVKKYGVAFSGLTGIALWFFYTLLIQIQQYNWRVLPAQHPSAFQILHKAPAYINQLNQQELRTYYNIAAYLPIITIIYIAGLVFNALRLLILRSHLSHIKNTISIDVSLQHKVNDFIKLLNINKKVRLGLSKLVDVPCMVGYLKPIILLPLSLSTQLSANEIESILLHELAHIKRNDYLITMIQQVIGTLLFFNPCTHLINRIINEERENCCDDLVIQATESPLIYAKALLKIEQTRQNLYQPALAATGKKYFLLNRIERIMKTKKTVTGIRPTVLTLIALTVCICSIAWLNPSVSHGEISIRKIKSLKTTFPADTIAKSTAKGTHSEKAATTRKLQKKSHTTNKNYYVNATDDSTLTNLSNELTKYGEAMSAYYDNPDFKKLEDEITSKSDVITAFYDRPELKNLQEQLDMRSAEFDKLNNNAEIKELEDQSNKLGESITKYFNSPTYKQLEKEFTKEAGLYGKAKYGTKEYEAHQKAFQKLQAEFSEYSNSPIIKQQQEEIRKTSQKIRDYFESSEYKEQQMAVRGLGDSLRNAYQSTTIKQEQVNLQNLEAQMRAYNNSAQINDLRKKMAEANARMKKYLSSPEYKKMMAEATKNAQAWKSNNNNSNN